MDTIVLQQELFKIIRTKLPEHLSAADEIARILDISTDSAYRRMRGEKTITLDELSALCLHYQISLDDLMNIQTGAFLFQGNIIDSATFRFDKYMESTLKSMAYMNTFKQKDFYYLCKDIPFFLHYSFREIAAFKHYFWMKTLFQFPEFARRKFSFKDYTDESFQLGQKIYSLYNSLNLVEIWNIESMNSTLRQIDFYREVKMFESDEDAWKIYTAMEKLIDHLEAQADIGYLYNSDDPERKQKGNYRFYFNEVILGDNTMLVELDGMKTVYLVHSSVNYMATKDLAFCNHTYNTIQNIMQKSTLMSSAQEHERARFFKFLRDRIKNRKESLRV